MQQVEKDFSSPPSLPLPSSPSLPAIMSFCSHVMQQAVKVSPPTDPFWALHVHGNEIESETQNETFFSSHDPNFCFETENTASHDGDLFLSPYCDLSHG